MAHVCKLRTWGACSRITDFVSQNERKQKNVSLFFHQLKVIYLRFLRVIKVLLLSRNFIDISYTIVMLESPILYVDTGLMIKTLSSLSCKGSIKNSFLWKMLSDLTCTIVLLIHLLIFCVLSIKVILPQINCH